MQDNRGLTPWLEDLQAELGQLLTEPDRNYQELLVMSNRLLYLSRCLMELATKASQAAQSIIEASAPKNQAD